MHRSALLLVVLVAVATGCPEGARPGDGAVPPSSAFDAPQAIAASQRFVLVEHVLPENIKAELQVAVHWFTELAELAPTQSQ